MIVERVQLRVKPGCVDEAIEVLQEMWKLVDPFLTASTGGSQDRMIQSIRNESLRTLSSAKSGGPIPGPR